jgi:hypothetical protein
MSYSNLLSILTISGLVPITTLAQWKYKKPHGDYKQKDLTSHGDLLYNLKDDPCGTTNLIDKYPEIAKDMMIKMQKFIAKLGSLPEPKIKTYDK